MKNKKKTPAPNIEKLRATAIKDVQWSNDENKKLGIWLLTSVDGNSILHKSKSANELEDNIMKYYGKKGSVAKMVWDDDADEGLSWVTFGDLFSEVKSVGVKKSYAQGGAIINQYEGKYYGDVWDKDWTDEQKHHFLVDHKYEIGYNEEMYQEPSFKRATERFKTSHGNDAGFMLINSSKLIKSKSVDLPTYVYKALKKHIREGQYAQGGNIAYKRGGALIGNQYKIDLNKNGKIDAQDFKLLRASMNGAWRNERKHVNHAQDYEVRYARKKPARTGYKGKRNFSGGGDTGSFTNEHGIKVKSVFKPAKKPTKAEWLAKHNKSNEATVMFLGGAFKNKMSAKAFPNVNQKQVMTKSGEYVQILDQMDDVVYVMPLSQLGTGVKPIKMNISELDEKTFKMGGGISNFQKLSNSVARNYVGKRVKPKYQREYGKTYSKEEAKEVGNKVAGKMRLMKKASKPKGNPKMKQAITLAKEIRKPKEKWTDAVKRAYAQLNK